jgi:2'-5' RNA ligase
VRLFVAVDLDITARAAISASVSRLRAHAECRQGGLSRSVTWVAGRNLHLTVHFLGEIEDACVPGLQSSLARPLGIDPADVGFGGWGVFPSHGSPRVVWIGVTDGLSSLERAHALVGERLAELGVGIEARRFSPHLTVGRVKAPSWDVLRGLVDGGDVPVAARCAVTQCTLYRSRLSPDGATYEALGHTPFQS